MQGVLEGIKVLDLSRYIAGPLCTTIMADMGAEVIRLEQPGGAEDREQGPPSPRGDSMRFNMLSRNKKGITLNLESAQGREMFHRLIEQCDVVVENFSPPVKEKLGVTYDALTKLRPDVILATVSAFGTDGPYRNRLAFDHIGQAESGSMSISGFPDAPPTRFQVSWVDMGTALHLTVGVVMAILHRYKTGQGQVVEGALFDTAVAMVSYQGTAAEVQAMDLDRPRVGNAGYYNYADTFNAKDGMVMVAFLSNPLWRRVANLLGRPELIGDPRFADDTARYLSRQVITGLIAEWVARRTTAQVLEEMGKARLPCGRVNTVREMVADPQVAWREMFTMLDIPGIGPVIHPRLAFRMSRTPGRIVSPAPRPGEHNAEVYRQLLGLSPDDVEQLHKDGVV